MISIIGTSKICQLASVIAAMNTGEGPDLLGEHEGWTIGEPPVAM